MLQKQPLRTVIATHIAQQKSLPRLDHLMARKRRRHLGLAQVSARDLHIVPLRGSKFFVVYTVRGCLLRIKIRDG